MVDKKKGGARKSRRKSRKPTEESRTLQELMHAAQKGDHSAVPELNAALVQDPRLYRGAGDLSLQAKRMWLDQICGTDLHRRQCILHKLSELRQQLLQAGPPTIVRELLVDEILCCWLRRYYYEMRDALSPDVDSRTGAFWLKQLDSSARRYLKSLRMLDEISQTLLPASPAPSEAQAVPATGTATPEPAAPLKSNRLVGRLAKAGLN